MIPIGTNVHNPYVGTGVVGGYVYYDTQLYYVILRADDSQIESINSLTIICKPVEVAA